MFKLRKGCFWTTSSIKLLQKHSTKDGYELFLRNAVETKWIVQTTKGIEKLWEDL